MKMFLLVVVVCVAIAAGYWAWSRPEPSKSPLVPEIQAWFNDSLKDPDSLQIIRVDTGENVVDGMTGHAVVFRSKNGFGGYGDPEVILFKVGNGRAIASMRFPYVPD